MEGFLEMFSNVLKDVTDVLGSILPYLARIGIVALDKDSNAHHSKRSRSAKRGVGSRT